MSSQPTLAKFDSSKEMNPKKRQEPKFKRWTDEEEATLIEELLEDPQPSLTELAGSHGRSERAISLRLQKMLYEKQQGGEDITPYYKIWPVTEREMNEFIKNGGVVLKKGEAELLARIGTLEGDVNALKEEVAELRGMVFVLTGKNVIISKNEVNEKDE